MSFTNEEIEKYSSEQYSLLDDQWLFIKREFIKSVIPLNIFLPIIGLIISLIMYRHIKSRYTLVKIMKEQYQYREIFELFKSSDDYWRNGFCIYSLVDLKDTEIIDEITILLDDSRVLDHAPTRLSLEKAQKVLAIKLNYKTIDEMLKYSR